MRLTRLGDKFTYEIVKEKHLKNFLNIVDFDNFHSVIFRQLWHNRIYTQEHMEYIHNNFFQGQIYILMVNIKPSLVGLIHK